MQRFGLWKDTWALLLAVLLELPCFLLYVLRSQDAVLSFASWSSKSLFLTMLVDERIQILSGTLLKIHKALDTIAPLGGN